MSSIAIHTLAIFSILLTIINSELCPDNLHCDFCLTKQAFSMGTFRIIQPGKYCLSEDIEFNPRQPESLASPNGNIFNWYPGEYGLNDLLSYPGTLENIARNNPVNGPFAGGFFAAISIETVNVEIEVI